MKPSQLLDTHVVKLPFGKDKVINAGRYLRAFGMYRSGKKGSEDQVTINEGVILLYALAADITKSKTRDVLNNLCHLKSENNVYFFDRMRDLLMDWGKPGAIEKIEISHTFPYVNIHTVSGEIEKYFVYSTESELVNLVKLVTILPGKFLIDYSMNLMQNTNTGSMFVAESQFKDQEEEYFKDRKKIMHNSPTREDILKAIS